MVTIPPKFIYYTIYAFDCSFHLENLLFQLKADFLALLKETSGIERSSRWSEIKRKIDSDPRYKAVDSSSRREDWFRDYTRKLEDVSQQHDRHNFLL